MKKIINCVGGSFFRTLGRIFAFFVVSLIFIFILSKTDLKMPKFADLLGVAIVKASEVNVANVKYNIYVKEPNIDRKSCGYQNMGTQFISEDCWNRTIGVNSYLMVDGVYITLNATSSIFSGTSYNSSFILSFNPRGNNPTKEVIYTNIQQCTNNTFNSCIDTIAPTCTFTKVVSNNYQVKVNCNFTSFNNSQYFFINFRYDINNYSNYNNLSNYTNFYNFTLSSNDATTDAINNQTNIIINNNQETQDKLDNITDNITDDNVTESNTEYSNFFSGFTTNTHGLTSIITAPLSLIGSITSSSCSPLGLPLPFINETLTLPCLSTIYSTYFGNFFTIYQTITFGIIAYWVIVRIFSLVKDFKNPDHDEIEVLDL